MKAVKHPQIMKIKRQLKLIIVLYDKYYYIITG